MVDGKIIHLFAVSFLTNMHQALYIKIKSFVLIILFFVLSSCSQGDYKLAEGGSGKLDDFLGKWLVINYWADWCPPCIKEMPELESFYLENKSDVMVLAFNFDRLEGKELQDQIARFGVNVPSIITDPGVLFGWDSPSSLPATYVINPKGELIHTLIGPQTKESLETYIN